MKVYVFLITLLIAFSSKAQNTEDEITYNGYIENENVYIQLSTVDKPTMHAMLSRGFYVYFDIKGKKKKNVSVQYPINITPPQRPQRPDRNSSENTKRDENDEERKGPAVDKIIEELTKTASYINFDEEQEFHLELNNLGISLAYTFDEPSNELRYSLIIPKDKIAANNADFSKLSVGIVTPERATENKNDGPSMSLGGQGGGGQRGGGQGGGGQRGGGGRGQGGGGGQRGGQGGPSGQNQRPAETTINLWFKLSE